MENLIAHLEVLSNVLHWMGKYNEANAIVLLGRLLRNKDIYSLDRFEEWVKANERAFPVQDRTGTPPAEVYTEGMKHCPHCFGSFGLAGSDKDNICPWCKNNVLKETLLHKESQL